MKNGLIVAAILGVFAVAPMVQAADSDVAKQPSPRAERHAARTGSSLMESSAVIGAKVENREGKDVGKIDQLILNSKGVVRDAVVTVGGVAGVGGKKVVVPWRNLVMRDQDGKIVAQVDQAVVDKAPEFDKTALKRERSSDRMPAASPATEPTPTNQKYTTRGHR